MMKTRGGAKQRKKHEEVFQYHRNQGNVGLKLLEKLGWEEGKGLGDGKGRCGKPWGFKGHFARKEEVIQTEDIVWQWTLTSEDGAKFAFAGFGLPFPGSQVVEVPKLLSSCHTRAYSSKMMIYHTGHRNITILAPPSLYHHCAWCPGTSVCEILCPLV